MLKRGLPSSVNSGKSFIPNNWRLASVGPHFTSKVCAFDCQKRLSSVASSNGKKPSATAPADSPQADCIEIRGARQNNLKGFDLDLPLGQLTVVTGPSGSGKSSLAFDTIYAEGQRRYVETFSPYTRQFLDRMDKPRVDEIRGIPPAIAIEQSNPVKSSRSTVGTMTEINDYLKLLMPRVAHAFCPSCGREIRPETAQSIAEQMIARFGFRSPALPNDAVSGPNLERGSASLQGALRARPVQPSSSRSGFPSRQKPSRRLSSPSSSNRATCAFG